MTCRKPVPPVPGTGFAPLRCLLALLLAAVSPAQEPGALLAVTTTPPGAAVYVDGLHQGNTPLTATIPLPGGRPRRVTVSVVLAEREPRRAVLLLGPGETVSWIGLQLSFKAGVPFDPPPGWPGYLADFRPPREGLSYRLAPVDAMPQVLVPAGELVPPGGDRQVTVGAFWADLHEVTNAQYGRFLQATGRPAPEGWQRQAFGNGALAPATGLGWYDAVAYADWTGRRLPTEAQWLRAVAAETPGTRYPWGDAPDAAAANLDWGGSGATACRPVAKGKATGVGLYDLLGNVWEWCLDAWDATWPEKLAGPDPLNHRGDGRHVRRGGGWTSGPDLLPWTARQPDGELDQTGFRCVTPVPSRQ